MSLWSIARSPLMHGGDMAKMDDFTLSLLTNDEVLAVNQDSTNNRPMFNRENLIAWTADVPNSPDKYLAVFNARDRYEFTAEYAAWKSPVINRDTPGQGVAVDVDLTGAKKLYLVVDNAGDAHHWDHALWVEPRLIAADGTEKRLTELSWSSATAWGNQVSTERAPSNNAMRVAGRPVPYGIGAHAKSIIEYDLPVGFQRFRAFAALDDAAMRSPRGATIEFMVFTAPPGPDSDKSVLPVPVSLAEVGFSGPVRVRDLWARQDLGEARNQFAPEIPWHGAGLFRLSPVGL